MGRVLSFCFVGDRILSVPTHSGILSHSPQPQTNPALSRKESEKHDGTHAKKIEGKECGSLQ
jgi:hypothetical protein